MAFAQLTGRESLRKTILCLNAVPAHLYHLGLPTRLIRSNIAHANHRRNWKIFYDSAMILLAEAKTFYQTTSHDFNFDGCVYAFDSTTIDLCLSMFPYTDHPLKLDAPSPPACFTIRPASERDFRPFGGKSVAYTINGQELDVFLCAKDVKCNFIPFTVHPKTSQRRRYPPASCREIST